MEFKKHIRPGTCSVLYCQRKVKQCKVCSTCRSRKSRQANLLNYAYVTNRNNAKRRGKIFTITVEQFAKVCYKYDFLAGKGRSRESYGMDCIDPEKGYVYGNIRPMQNWMNSKKGKKKLDYDWETGYARVRTLEQVVEDNFDDGLGGGAIVFKHQSWQKANQQHNLNISKSIWV